MGCTRESVALVQEYKTIDLINGGKTIVDSDDYELFSKFRWFQNSGGYAHRQGWTDKVHWTIWLHREINKTPPHLFTDHINGNKLDNRKCNLRTCNKSQNGANVGKSDFRNPSSFFKGVAFHKATGLWRARVKDKTTYHRTDHDAAFSYNKMAVEMFGEFARTNVLPDDFVPGPPITQKKHSIFRGVGKSRTGNWTASIYMNNTEKHLGTFKTEIEAAEAYNNSAIAAYGEKAKLNQIERQYA